MKPDAYCFDESTGFWIYLIHTQGSAALRKTFAAAGLDLTPEQWAVLTRVQNQRGMSQSQLCEKTVKDRHNINRIVNILEKRGHIRRHPDENDKRAYRLYLTATGQAIQEKAMGVVRAYHRNAYCGLKADELSTLRKMLRQIFMNIEKINKNGPPPSGEGVAARCNRGGAPLVKSRQG